MDNFLTLREALYGAISGAILAAMGWLFGRRKSNAEAGKSEAEAIHIHAQTVRVSAEAQQVSTRTIIEAHGEIAELLEVNSVQRNELVEVNRRLDNSEFELRQARYETSKLQERVDLQMMELQQRDSDIKKYLAILEINKIKPSDYDKPKQ